MEQPCERIGFFFFLLALSVFNESICQTALPHLILSDAHLTSVGYSFPTAVANLCVTKDIFAGRYFSYNYIELTKQFFFAQHVMIVIIFENCVHCL